MNLQEAKTDVLRDLYSRLNTTLSEVEKVVKKLADPKKRMWVCGCFVESTFQAVGLKCANYIGFRLTTKSEEEQLFLIQSALRGMVTPLRRQLSTSKVNQTASKVNQRCIFSSCAHHQKKNGKSTRDAAPGTFTRSTKHSKKKANGSQVCWMDEWVAG